MDDGAKGATVHIAGLEIRARHGLLPQEKESEQLFRFDLDLRLDSCEACVNDSIDATVDYAAVCDEVVALVRGRSFDLLERMAEEVAAVILDKFTRVDAVTVRAEKAAPPLEHKVAGVAVSIARRR